ncbi:MULTISPECIES: MarR family winged helix-turn-helix transcriptional regulator [Catenuloplanes]|uniref:DNA-binding MarR family transcriptional regulator n=1 Tax=Catenuloplanes niger TaxID=587534 RepID=A0AAE3ZK26_9ACTN|nr:MarR family transcriptional regulator [Catenuloplanes niger]MDR7320656.1 DNA-binding MarR family transcriptional regulator [Catenuloplanes niger]
MSDLELAEELRAAIGDFVRRARAHDEMPPGQAAVLGHLDRSGPLSIADLARLEQVKHQSMARTVGLLTDRDLVTAGRHEADRRQVVLSLTPAGGAALASVRHARAAGMARAIHDLDDAEREIVRRIPAVLRKLQP